jgi:hypothetical protein
MGDLGAQPAQLFRGLRHRFAKIKTFDELHFKITTLTFSEGVIMLLISLSTGPTFKRTSHPRYLYQGGLEWLPIFICAWFTLR